MGEKDPASPKRVAADLNRAAVALGKVAADLVAVFRRRRP